MLPREAQILLIDDSPSDAELLKEAIHAIEANITLHHVPDVVGALAFLFKENRHTKAPKPDVILLDLTLPDIPGEEALRIIKQTENINKIPVVILTSMEDAAKHSECKQLGAVAIWVKPPTWNEYLHLVEIIRECLQDRHHPAECIEERSAEL